MINVVIAEDHESLIEGIELFFEFEDDISIVGTANTGKDLMGLLEKKRVNIVIVDIRMPDMDGIEATRLISKKYPEIKVIAFTMFDQKIAVAKMLQAGAKGYLLKNSSLKNLLEAVRQVEKGNTYYDSNLPVGSVETLSPTGTKKKGKLSKRQYEILELIGEGKTNTEISEILFIGKHTVATHRKNIMQKLDISGQHALISYAIKKRYDFD
ncbi:MAG: response regulator transcription factor [Bacteroidota bacterium]